MHVIIVPGRGTMKFQTGILDRLHVVVFLSNRLGQCFPTREVGTGQEYSVSPIFVRLGGAGLGLGLTGKLGCA